MTTSELILSKIVSRLAVVVVLAMLGHLPDQHHRPPTTQADATEPGEASPQAPRLADRKSEAVNYTD